MSKKRFNLYIVGTISTILFLIFLVSCRPQSQKDVAIFSGEIQNRLTDSIILIGFNPIDSSNQRIIKLSEEGLFSDTFKTAPVTYYLMHGISVSNTIFLQSGSDLSMKMDGKNQFETITFGGEGKNANDYLYSERKYNKEQNLFLGLETLGDAEFTQKINSIYEKERDRLKEVKSIHPTFFAHQNDEIDHIESSWLDKRRNSPKKLIGQLSPKFTDYINYNGGTSSLDDFKGKYVYIDMWATWCGPCKKEIPYLEEIEKIYHNKNIEFVSISVDKLNARSKWEKMIVEKKMSGVQLLADKDISSQFYKDYKITGIPRFIFLDPDGIIISAEAPRPSDKVDITKLFDAVL